MSDWWVGFLASGWTLAVVPTAVALSALVAFWKTWLEKRNVELENRKLQVEVSEATSRIILPTDDQVAKYGFAAKFARRTIRISAILLAMALPMTWAIQTTRPEDQSAGHTPPVVVRPVPEDESRPRVGLGQHWFVGDWTFVKGNVQGRMMVSTDSSVVLDVPPRFRKVFMLRPKGSWELAEGATVRLQLESASKPEVLNCRRLKNGARPEAVCVDENKIEWRLRKEPAS